MIEIVINYDTATKEYKLYEPSTDTLILSANLGDTFNKLSDFLKDKGLITESIFKTKDINYHLDSSTMSAILENNVKLMKRLNDTPSGFMVSSKKFNGSFGSSSMQSSSISGKRNNNSGDKSKYQKVDSGLKRRGGQFKNSSFNESSAKFGRF